MKKAVQCFIKQMLFIVKYVSQYGLPAGRSSTENRHKIALGKENVKNL
jgi:hypothetical protein